MSIHQSLKRLVLVGNIPRFSPTTYALFHKCYPNNAQIKNIDGDFQDNKQNTKTKKLKNIYQQLCNWKDLNELTEQLFENIVYYEPDNDKSGLIVLNKPHGLPKLPTDDCKYALEPSLPLLAKKLDVDNLQVIKCTERFTSGITLLGTSASTAKNYNKAMDRCVTTRTLPAGYISIVKGSPNLNRNEDVDIVMKAMPQVNDPLFGVVHKEPVISRYLAKSWKRRRQFVKRAHVHIETVARSPRGAGLVSVSPSSVGKHLLQVYLADVGHPVIGDMMYDYRARTLMGHKIKVTSATNARRTQILPDNILELLGLVKGEEWQIPKMVHQYKLMLPHWLPGGKDVTIFAPPPAHFVKTCQALDINFNFKDFIEQDTVSVFAANSETVAKRKKKQEAEQQQLSDLQSSIIELDQ